MTRDFCQQQDVLETVGGTNWYTCLVHLAQNVFKLRKFLRIKGITSGSVSVFYLDIVWVLGEKIELLSGCNSVARVQPCQGKNPKHNILKP